VNAMIWALAGGAIGFVCGVIVGFVIYPHEAYVREETHRRMRT